LFALDQDAPIPIRRASPTEAQRAIAEIAELAGGLAHELRNPLSTMMINLKLLAEDLSDTDASPEDVRRRALLKVDTLRREAERLQSLFDDFLNLTGPCRLQRAKTDLNAVVARLIEFFEPLAHSEGIEVRTVGTQNPLVCPVDEKLLSQALLNIVVNAQQAMPEGGELTLTTAVEGDQAVLTVSDTGVGIAQSDRERILRPFFSTKASGNGLGLSLTRRVIQEHGGTLSFESELGRGTTFTIRLPLHPPDPDAEQQPG
jgi:two-component system sensor histidine kinase HydH